MAADGNPDFVVNSPELVLNSSGTGYLHGPVYEQNDAGLWVKTTTKFDTNFEFAGSIVEIYNAAEELLETTDTTVNTTASGSKEVGTYEVEGEVVKSCDCFRSPIVTPGIRKTQNLCTILIVVLCF